jgi:hypothetical protein
MYKNIKLILWDLGVSPVLAGCYLKAEYYQRDKVAFVHTGGAISRIHRQLYT